MSRTIAVLQTTLDGRILDAEGASDWVDSWADGLRSLPPVDAFVLGGGMFEEYEGFWTAVRDDPDSVTEWLGRPPDEREIAYAKTAAETPHLVVSSTLGTPKWPSAELIGLDDVKTLHDADGPPIYVVGGPTLISGLIGSGLLDELRLIVHPVLAGGGRAWADAGTARSALQLKAAEPAANGRLHLTYTL